MSHFVIFAARRKLSPINGVYALRCKKVKLWILAIAVIWQIGIRVLYKSSMVIQLCAINIISLINLQTILEIKQRENI